MKILNISGRLLSALSLVLFLSCGQNNDALDQLQAKVENNPEDVQALMELGRAYEEHNQLEKALEIFKKAQQLRSDDPIAAVSYAQVENKLAREAEEIPEKVKWVQYSIADFDAAVQKFKGNWYVHFIRGVNSSRLPVMFQRTRIAIEDLELVLQMIEKNSEEIPDKILPELYFSLGLAYDKDGQQVVANQYWGILQEKFADSEYIAAIESYKHQKEGN